MNLIGDQSTRHARTAADTLGDVARAIEDLGYRMEAEELIISALAKKERLTDSQVRRGEFLRPASGPEEETRHLAVFRHVARILALADK